MTTKLPLQVGIHIDQLDTNINTLDDHSTFMEEMVYHSYESIITLLMTLRDRIDPKISNIKADSPASVEQQLDAIINLMALVNADCNDRILTMDQLISDQRTNVKWLVEMLTQVKSGV